MKRRAYLLPVTLLLASASLPAHAEQSPRPAPAEIPAVVQSSMLLRGVAKCARSAPCRMAVAERASRIAKRTIELMTELALDSIGGLYDLLGEIISAPSNREVLAKLDRLEEMLKQNGVHCPELQRDIEAIRAMHR